MRDTQLKSFTATMLSTWCQEDIICKKLSVIDLVYNHTITLECELKVVRQDAVVPRAADITSMDSQREPKACDAFLQSCRTEKSIDS